MVHRHYYYFGSEIQKKMVGDNLNMENWDLLRNDEKEGPFSIEKTVEAYEANCKDSHSYEGAANIITREIGKMGYVSKVVSLGVGKGILEWHLKRLNPELRVECTDYAEESVEKLRKVFVNMDDGYPFDMMDGDYRRFGSDSLMIMYRVSTEFNRKQWDDVFMKMHSEGIERIIFVPAELCTIKDIIREEKWHFINRLTGHKDIFCGWMYSESEFLRMFRGTGANPLYKVESRIPYENTAIYYLSSR